MAPLPGSTTPGLATLLKSISSEPVETSIEYYTSLLRRRQIRGSKPCAIATAYLLRRVISTTRANEYTKLLNRIHAVGKRLVDAAPRELAIGNIVRRVSGLIRDEEEESREPRSGGGSEAGSIPSTPQAEITPTIPGLTHMLSSTTIAPRREQQDSSRPPLLSSHTGIPGASTRPVTSMFSILSHPTMRSGTSSPTPIRSGSSTPGGLVMPPANTDVRAEILEGISEIIDELDQSDEQIANYALEHIHPTETIFTYSSSQTVQKFLLKAASKRKFTVIHAESYPNNHAKTHSIITGNPPVLDDSESPDSQMSTESFQKPLIAAGITVLLVPDSAIFAMMSRANKVVISAHAVLANGSVISSAGSKALIKAARFHRVPVIVLAATYKLSPLFPHDPYEFIEYGDVSKVVEYQDSELRNGLEKVRNPVWDFVEADGIDLFVTNLGGCASGYMYRVVRDQYRDEDADM